MNPVSSRVFSAQMAHFHLALALHLLEGVWLSHPPSFEEIRVRLLSGAKGGLGFPGRVPAGVPRTAWHILQPGTGPPRHGESGIPALGRFGNPWSEDLASGRGRRGRRGSLWFLFS